MTQTTCPPALPALRPLLRFAAALVSCLSLLHCTPLPEKQATLTPAAPVKGAAIVATPNSWTWVDFPDAVCDDGSPTGIGINVSSTSKNLIVFLNGGGACWDYSTCVVANTSTHGPFNSFAFGLVAPALSGSLLDRSLAGNPVADYNMVFVPYCTGDLHGGDNTVSYSSGVQQKVIYHKGRANIAAYLKRLAATFPAPPKLVVSGSSAGGFGAALNYDLFRSYFPSSKSYLLDDSGPLLIGDAVSPDLRTAWFSSWGLANSVGPLCPTCGGDLSLLLPTLAALWPSDRSGLLSYTQDGTISKYVGETGAQFEPQIRDLAKQRYDGQPRAHYYLVTGTAHTFLGKPAATTAQNLPLLTWLTQFVSDDPTWTSTKP